MTVRIGDRGRASTILRPGGFVTVADVRHPARSASAFIDVATEVIVIGGDNLGLIVRELESSTAATPLSGHGNIVYSSFGEKIAVVGKAREERRIARRQRALSRSWIFGGVCGLVCSVLAAYQLRPAWQVISPVAPWTVPGLLIVVGCLWGLAVGRCLCGAFEQIADPRHSRLTDAATITTLAGTTAALIYVIPHRGLWVGLATALCTTVVLGGALPALALVGEWLSGSAGEELADPSAAADAETD